MPSHERAGVRGLEWIEKVWLGEVQQSRFLTTPQAKEALAKRPHGPGSAGVLACPRPKQPTQSMVAG